MCICSLLLSVSTEPLGPGQLTEYRESDKMYIWKIKKLEGGEEEQLIMKVLQLYLVIP